MMDEPARRRCEDQRFKKEREAWISGMFALGLSEMECKEYWVEIETEEQTPDTKVHYIDQSPEEACAIVEHIDDPLVSTLVILVCGRALLISEPLALRWMDWVKARNV